MGDRAAHIRGAIAGLDALPDTRMLACSSITETSPVPVGGVDPGGTYFNAAATFRTSLGPERLLHMLHAIERRLGRDRASQPHGAPRTIDLDLLLHGDHVIQSDSLILPHPRMHERLFVLQPLSEIAPGLVVPTLRRTIADLLAELHARSRAVGATS